MNTCDKLAVLSDAAKYDASCSSSGGKRRNAGGTENGMLDAIVCRAAMAGRRTRAGVGRHLVHASLREDYLSQVQRDFLSRAARAVQHP